MEYKLYNSNTLKSVQINEDTNLIFELNKVNCDKVFLNTVLYSSQYGCPISFSLIQNVNVTTNVGFGNGAVLDFMYKLSVDSGKLVITHPTNETEDFVFNQVSRVSSDGSVEEDYFYSTTTTSYIKRVKIDGVVDKYYYINGSFVTVYDSTLNNPIKFSRNGINEKQMITISYVNNKVSVLTNEAIEQEKVIFSYTTNCTQFIVYKKFDKSTDTLINKVEFTYSNNSLNSIKETMHGKTIPVRHTSFTRTTGSLVIKNEISTLFSTINYSTSGVSSISMQDDTITVTYVDNYETNININGMWEKYFFDFNFNLQHIENSVGQVKTFQYDNTQRRLLLLESKTLYANNYKNYSQYLDNTEKNIISNNGYVFSDVIDTTCPVGSEITNVNICQTYEDEESNFTFRFTKKGKRFDIENVILWYKINSYPSSASNTDINVSLYFYKTTSSAATLIKSESLYLNAKVTNKWFFNIFAGQAAEDYDYVDIYVSTNDYDYSIDFNVELLSDSFAKIYKYDSLGRAKEVLSKKQILKFKYNEDNQLIGSSVCILSYDENGKPDILVTSNYIQNEITKDDYGNVTLSKSTNKDQSKYIKSSKAYIDNEHLSSENTNDNSSITYLFDDKKRTVSSIFLNTKSTISYSSSDNSNFGKISKMMHSYLENSSYSNIDGSQVNYNDDGTVKTMYHLNLASAPDYTYSYEYDSQKRLNKLSLGNTVISAFSYSFDENKRTESISVNGDTITYNYDENERLISKTISDGSNAIKAKYNYIYEDITTRVKSIENEITNEAVEFNYDGHLLKNAIYGNYKTEYSYNNDGNRQYERKYFNNSLISTEKETDNSLIAKKDNILKFELDVANNEDGMTYQTNFIKKVKKYSFDNQIYNDDITKALAGIYGSDIIENSLITPSNTKYGFDGLSNLSFTSGDSPLLYKFINHSSPQSNWNGLGLQYSVFVGFQLDSFDNSKPILQLCNNSTSALDSIAIYVTSNSLKIHLTNSTTNITRQETFSISYKTNQYNFIALNVTMDQTYKYSVSLYFNGVLLGNVNNVQLTNDMTNVYVFGNTGQQANLGKVTSIIVKRIGHISAENIKLYSIRLLDIKRMNNLTTQFNKKTRLSNSVLPIILYDNTFNSFDNNIKPYKLSFNKDHQNLSDYFVFDEEALDNVMVLRNQSLAYDFGLSTSGIVGVRFKRVSDVTTNILSLNDSKLYIHVQTSSNGIIDVTVNANTYSPAVILNTSWNNIFVKWEKVVASASVDECVYNLYLYVNESVFSLGEHVLDGDVSKMIVSVGKPYLNSDITPGCFGYIEKAIGCSSSISMTTLNSLFNNSGESLLNEYDEFGQKRKRSIRTASSLNINQTFTFDVNDDGRVTGTLSSDNTVLKNNNVITNYYTYNLDKTIKTHRIFISSNNSNVTKSFTYDKKKQLTHFTDGTNTYTYTYDNMGNVTQIEKNDVIIHTATYSNGMLQNSVNGYTITYNSSGYPTAKKSGTTDIEKYSWVGGLLESIELVQQQRKFVFTYAANGLRTSKKELHGTDTYNTTYYYYNADGLLAYETRTLNNIKLEYLYDAEGLLYGVYYNGTPYYYIKDALGTITNLIDASGSIVTKLDYDGVYGKHSVTDVNSIGSTHISFINPFRYKGYYYDDETQLYWVSSRYYSPELCRWISPDSIEYLDPQSINGLNLYCYCHNNPVM